MRATPTTPLGLDTNRASGTRHPERPILFACGSVGLLFALLAVLERVGVERSILGALAVALPLTAAGALAVIGRTIERLPFAVDGTRGGTLAGGLALGAEWMGVWLVPAVVLVAPNGTATVLGTAFGLVTLVLVVAGTLRRTGALTLPAFLARRTGSAVAALAVAPAAALAVGALCLFQLALLHTLLVPFVGTGADATLLALLAAAALVCLVGGQRSLTLVNAFLAFFLTLAMVVPALAAIAGVEGLTAALPLDRSFAAALPGAGEGPVANLLVLGALALTAVALPTHAARLAAVRAGGLSQAGAWAMLTGYVTMTAAALAFARANVSSGLLVAANGEPSILSVLPALGWLGAVWAGAAMSLFTLAVILARDLRPRAPNGLAAAPWMDTGGLAAMRLLFIAVVLAVLALAAGLVPWPAGLFTVETAGLALSLVVATSVGLLTPALLAGIFWRHVTWPGLFLGQVAGAALVWLLWPLVGTLALAFAAGAANSGAIFAGSFATPRRLRPAPSLVMRMRDG